MGQREGNEIGSRNEGGCCIRVVDEAFVVFNVFELRL